MRLKGKVAIITGAASGIGRASALLFANEGAMVVVADINDSEGHRVIEEIKQGGNEASFIHVDVGVVDDLKRLVETTVGIYGKLDIFWSNAGIAGPGKLEHTTEEAYEKTMAVLLKASMFGAKFAISEMRKVGGGCILFTSSISGLKPSPYSVTYGVAKAGVTMLTRILATTLGRDNIRVNCICPGPVETPMLTDISERLKNLVSQEQFHETNIEQTPLKRYVSIDEVAQAALFLASDNASGITGVAFPVDGGRSAV